MTKHIARKIRTPKSGTRRGPLGKHNDKLMDAARYSKEFLQLTPSKGYRVCSMARMRAKVRMALRGQLEINDAFDFHAFGVAESIQSSMTN